MSKLSSSIKERDKIPNINSDINNLQDDLNINKPKSIYSNPNDISKLSSSSLSNKEIKIILSERNEIEKVGEISNNYSEKEKKDSNFSSIRAICDEINRAEKYINENKNSNLSNLSNIIGNENRNKLNILIKEKIIGHDNSKSMNKLNHDSNNKDELANDLINSDFSKNVILNNMTTNVQSANKDNLKDMDNRIHKINDKLNSIMKNSNLKTEETKYNTISNSNLRINPNSKGSLYTNNTNSINASSNNISNNKIKNPNSKSSCFKSLCG